MQLKEKIVEEVRKAGYKKIDAKYVGNIIEIDDFDDIKIKITYYQNQVTNNIVVNTNIAIDEIQRIVVDRILDRDDLMLLAVQMSDFIESFNQKAKGVNNENIGWI